MMPGNPGRGDTQARGQRVHGKCPELVNFRVRRLDSQSCVHVAMAQRQIDDETWALAPQHAVGGHVRDVRGTASQHREQSMGCGDRNQGQP